MFLLEPTQAPARTWPERRTRWLTLSAILLVSACAPAAGDDAAASSEPGDSPAVTSAAVTSGSTVVLEADAGAVQGTFPAALQADTEIFGLTPDTALGADSVLRVGKNIFGFEERAYVRFEVRHMVTIDSAVLRLFVPSNGTNGSISVAIATDAWEETTLTFNNATPRGPAIGTLSPTKAGQWASLDVTSTLQAHGNGPYSFVIFQTTNTTDNVTFTTAELDVTGTQNPEENMRFAVQGPLPLSHLSGAIAKSSGFAASHRYGNTYYTHNDGNDARVFAVRNNGELRGIIQLSDVDTGTVDFEDISVGPGPDALTSFVYLADIGNNKHVDKDYRILRFAEPSSFNASVPTTVTPDVLHIRFERHGDPSGDRLNAESVIVDPVTGSLWVIEKPCPSDSGTDPQGHTANGVNNVFGLFAPLPFGNTSAQPALLRAGIPISTSETDQGTCREQSATANQRVTGAGISVTGDRVAVTFYDKIFFWPRPVGIDLGTVLGWFHPTASSPLIVNTGFSRREAITFSRTATEGFFTTTDQNGTIGLPAIEAGSFTFFP